MLLSALAFYFVIVSTEVSWREAPGVVGYESYAECVEGQLEYRMNDEWGAFSECYAKEVIRAKKGEVPILRRNVGARTVLERYLSKVPQEGA